MKPYNKSLGHTFHFHKRIIENEYNQVLLWYFSIPSDFAKKNNCSFIFLVLRKYCGWIKAGFSADEIHLHLWELRISCKHKSTPAAFQPKLFLKRLSSAFFRAIFTSWRRRQLQLLFWTLLSLHKFCFVSEKALFEYTHLFDKKKTLYKIGCSRP